MRFAVLFPVICTFSLFLFCSCNSRAVETSLPAKLPALSLGSGNIEYYLAGDRTERDSLKDLFFLLENAPNDPLERFCIVREMATQLRKGSAMGKLVNLLNAQVEKHPDDPFNAWYLLMVAWIHMQEGSEPVAVLYFDRIVKNHRDLVIAGESVHLASLKQIITLTKDHWRRIACYQELLERFPEDIPLGQTLFSLAKTYEKTGEWDLALQTYARYLASPDTTVIGEPNAFSYAKLLIDFNNSSKDWSFKSLDELVEAVKTNIRKGNIRGLSRLMAKVNFNALSWGQDPSDLSDRKALNFSDLMTGTRIRYAEKIDPDSNTEEAWLRTWGWSQNVSVWYFHFRKIYFPAQADIHGRWEWAGVYYGEKN